jgi:hypothetical protein
MCDLEASSYLTSEQAQIQNLFKMQRKLLCGIKSKARVSFEE